MNRTKIGFIGLGKLGLPCAAAISVEAKVQIIGYDHNPKVKDFITSAKVPYVEQQCEEYLEKSDIKFVSSVREVIEKTDLVFLAIQTPHAPRFEGITPVPQDLSDFDYSYLESVVTEIASELDAIEGKKLHIVVISTVLPGTMRSLVLPKLEKFGQNVSFSYNPFFIAMGQTISDFLNPEFVLIGGDSSEANEELAIFYKTIHNAPTKIMSLESAELTKVAYNTFIGFKIVFANTLAEITEVRGGDVDEVTEALSSASMRLMSPKYMSAGMGDGGGCHPRDQIAMSWLARDAGLSTDMFGFLAKARDFQTQRQAEKLAKLSKTRNLPIVLLGKAYKSNINLTVGSPAILLSNYLNEMNVPFTWYDPVVDPEVSFPQSPSVFFVSTDHKIYRNLAFPKGSVILSPWKDAVQSQVGVDIVRPGRSRL